MIDREEIQHLLAGAESIAVVGASPNPERPSHSISLYLMSQGYRVYPVNPGHGELFGIRCWPDLESIPDPVHIVDVFRRPDRVMPIVEAAIKRPEIRLIWLQDGVVNPGAEQLAREQGIPMVMDDCIFRVHRRLF